MTAPPSTALRLGNPAPQTQNPVLDEYGAPTGEQYGVPAKHLNQTVTTVDMRPGFDNAEDVGLALSTDNDRMLSMIGRQLAGEDKRYAVGILEVEQIMAVHSAGAAPTWVDCDDADFARVLAEFYDCHLGEPTALLTNGGRDGLHGQHLGTAAQPAAFNFMALSESAVAPSAASTALPGEITTAGGGLLRAVATYAHSAGTNTSTLTKTFTGNASDIYPKVIAKIGVLNAAAAGVLGYETLLNATATLNVSGDNVAVTHTLTMG